MKITSYGGNELTNRDKYDFTIGGDTVKMQDARDIVHIDKYAIVQEEEHDISKEGDSPKTVLVVKDTDGVVYGTISETFIRTFIQCVEVFGDDFNAFSVKTGTSKNGREFITCVYED